MLEEESYSEINPEPPKQVEDTYQMRNDSRIFDNDNFMHYEVFLP